MSLSERTQLRLANLIAVMAEGEKRTEMVRQVLAEQNMFEPFTGNLQQNDKALKAFKRLDQARTGQLVVSDLVEFMADNKFTLRQDEAQFLYRCLDCNRDGVVTYPEQNIQKNKLLSFTKAILSREDSRLRQLATLRDSYYIEVNMLLPYEVEWALSRVFEQEIKNYNETKVAEELLTTCGDFNSLDAFKCIDTNFLGFITLDNLHEFTKQHGHYLGTDELLAFFRVVDLDEDGKISYSELLEAITYKPIFFSRDQEFREEFRRGKLLERDLEKVKDNLNQLQDSTELEIVQDGLQFEIRNIKLQEEMLERQLQYDLEKSLSKSRQLSEELSRSRERLIDLEYRDIAQRSRERIEQIEDIRRSREKIYQMKQDFQNELQKSRQQSAIIRSRLNDKQKQEDRETADKIRNSGANREIQNEERTEEIMQQTKETPAKKLKESQYTTKKQQSGEGQGNARQNKTDKKNQKQFASESKSTQKGKESPQFAQSRIYETPKKTIQRKIYSPQSDSEAKQTDTPMKGNEERQFVLVLKEEINLQKELDDIKNQLAFKSDFHPIVSFSLLDHNNRGQLTKLDFELALNDMGLFPTGEQIKLLYSHFCPNTSFLSYKAFLGMVLPQSEQYQELMFSRSTNNQLSPSTLAIFKSLMRKHFQIEDNIEILRNRLSKRPLFNITQAFQALDPQNIGYLTIEDFKEIFKVLQLSTNSQKHQIFITNKDLQGLLSLYDKNKDGKVTYSEFINEISPKKLLKF